jgi:hypothetical protein
MVKRWRRTFLGASVGLLPRSLSLSVEERDRASTVTGHGRLAVLRFSPQRRTSRILRDALSQEEWDGLSEMINKVWVVYC